MKLGKTWTKLSAVLAAFAFVMFGIVVVAHAENGSLRQVNVCVPQLSEGFAYLQIAKDKGFYEKEGLHVTVQRMKGVVCGQALGSSSVEFGAAPTTIYMALRKMPYRVVAVTANHIGHLLMVAPGIKSFDDLRGKMIAIDGPGGLIDGMTRKILKSVGLTPDKDVKFIAVGRPADREMALRSGSVAGSLLAGIGAIRMEEDGFRSLAYPPIIAATPLTVKTETLHKDPGMVYRFLKASAEGHLLFGKKTDEVMPSIMKFTKVEDRRLLRKVVQVRLDNLYNESGVLDEGDMKAVIASLSSQLKIKPPPSSQVFDFSPWQKAFGQLKAENWDGLFR